LSSAAMLRGPPLVWTRNPGAPQDAAHRRTGELQLLSLLEEFAQVLVVAPGISGLREGQHSRTYCLLHSVHRLPAAVAVDQGPNALRSIGGHQAPSLASG